MDSAFEKEMLLVGNYCGTLDPQILGHLFRILAAEIEVEYLPLPSGEIRSTFVHIQRLTAKRLQGFSKLLIRASEVKGAAVHIV